VVELEAAKVFGLTIAVFDADEMLK